MRIVSTLDIHSSGRETPELDTALDNLARFVREGGQVVYGTDLGNGPIPPGIHAGEARLLLRAGLTGEGVLEAMCPGPLAAGAAADVVALLGNPLEDPVWLADAALVIRSGRRMPLGPGG